MLTARPHANPPQWTTDPALMVRRAMELNQYRGIMGKVCLAANNLDFAGLYDPALHKFNMSEAVIDPSLNASADPTPVLQPLQESILAAVRAGTPLDRCLFSRIRGGIRAMFQERYPDRPFEPVLHCREHHQEWRQAQEAANRLLRERVKERGLLAHGPEEWLRTKFRIKLYNLAVQALEDRAEIWARKAGAEREIWKDETLAYRQKEAHVALLIREAKRAERETIREAYDKAAKTVDDLEPGQFMAAWLQAAASRAQRFRNFEPLRTNCLLHLPEAEIKGFFRKGESQATAIIRTTAPVNLPPGRPCFVAEVREGRKTAYQLLDAADETVLADLESEARHYLGLDLETAGSLPKLRVSGKRLNAQWRQAQNQIILRATNPQDA